LKQLVSDIRFFMNDNLNTSQSPEIGLIHRSIINNPSTHQTGNILLNSDNFKRFDLGSFNYIFIVADKRISIVIDDKLALYTSQFSYINPRALLSAVIFPYVAGETTVKYLFGRFQTGDVETGSTSSEETNDLNFDVQIDALIYDTDPCGNPLTSSVIDELSGLCEYDFTWDEALQKLILNNEWGSYETIVPWC